MKDKKERKHQAGFKIPDVLGIKVIPTGDRKRDLELALHRFKQMVKDSGLIEEIRDREHYVKPSIRKRNMLKKSIRNRIFQENKECPI